ncbi:MAG: TIGR04552 family protein [Bacteriovoracaceae bacterium]|nr:TIGR04552 family protein [Bacteriovoracaceae bacterium]
MTQRPDFIAQHLFNWETLHLVCSGESSLDAKNYLTEMYSGDQVYDFLVGYGFDLKNPVESAELFGIYQEALQFIKRYFLKEGNPDGLPLSVPSFLYTLTDISELFLLATGKKGEKPNVEESLWSGVVLKVMHTILHTDKDLRYRYFSVVQQQIFDRFYKYIVRDEENNLFIKNDSGFSVPLVDFQTKAKKTRESIIIKLLHKQENVAEELFDRIGVRIVTKSKMDSLRVLKFLVTNYVVMINNIKPSRSQNTLVDLNLLKKKSHTLLKLAYRQNWDEPRFVKELEALVEQCTPHTNIERNQHSSQEYRAIHFTGRQLIKYRNPFMAHFNEVRKAALQDRENPISKQLLALDTTPISRDVRFFYPFEVQITDEQSHSQNTQGEASHQEYKKSQIKSAMRRIFKPLIELKGL